MRPRLKPEPTHEQMVALHEKYMQGGAVAELAREANMSVPERYRDFGRHRLPTRLDARRTKQRMEKKAIV